MKPITFRAFVDTGGFRGICDVSVINFVGGTFVEYIEPKDGYSDYEKVSIKDCVLLQFTGFTDSAGREIYEGDIVEHRGRRWEIRWDELGQWVAALDYDGGTQKITPGSLADENGRIGSFAIVGNIYEGEQK